MEQRGELSKRDFPLGTNQTVDLQGVASFVSLVELLAQEFGTTAGRIQGQLPDGPTGFAELVGEIVLNGQGFYRTMTLISQPASRLRIRVQSFWDDGNAPETQKSGMVEAEFQLAGTTEEIACQGRALARYLEDALAVVDRMVTMNTIHKLGSPSPNSGPSTSQIEAFEYAQGSDLVRSFVPKDS